MHRISRIWYKLRGEKGGKELPAQSNLAARPFTVNEQVQPPATLLSAAPCSSAQVADSQTLPVPTSRAQLASDSLQLVQAQSERYDGQACDESESPKPYATNFELWNEALTHLDESEKHKGIKILIGELGCDSTNQLDVKSLAVAVQEKINVAFQTQQHDSRAHRVIENSVAVLGKFLSAVDVAVSFDPVHAALPWAAVRSVLVFVTSSSELQSQLLAGISMVASLLAQCDTYQRLYMAPDFILRPPEPPLSKLKTSIVQTYAKSQLFLSFAIQQQQSKIGPLAAPFKLGSAESHTNELSKCGEQLSQAADDCEKHCNLSNRSDIEGLLELNTIFHEIIQNQIGLVLDRINREEQIRLLEWISPIPYKSHHDRLKEARTSNTCEWLLKHKRFREWEAAGSSILWLQGSPGAGKTFLTSKVIDYSQALIENSSNQEGFAFFYCDRNEEQRRRPLSILQSYVRQLSTTVKNPGCMRKQLQDLCHKVRLGGSDLGLDHCRERLLESVNLYSQTTLVLDALDECELDSREKILETIEGLIARSTKPLKVFISSRPNQDIRKRFIYKQSIEIQATNNNEDIRKFVEEEIIKHKNWGTMSLGLRDEIIEVLYTHSQGMFQWAFLQIKQILGLKTETAIRDRLGKLPADLKTAYDNIYEGISSHPDDRAVADNAFKWVACACKPLKREELLSAIRLDSKNDTFDSLDIITESQLLDICNNLLVIDSKRYVWRFSHLSVAEYFEKNHWNLQKAHCHSASVCLKFLIETYKNVDLEEIRDCNSVFCSISYRDPISYRDHSFQKYAQRYWIDHIQAQEGQEADSALSQLLKSFLGSPEESSLQYRAWHHVAKHECWFIGGDSLEPEAVALFAMCRFSFYSILLDWWEGAEFDILLTNRYGCNLLGLAAIGGCKEICENLINRGIEVNLQLPRQKHGSALTAAAANGQAKVVKFLVNEARAEVNMQLQNGHFGSALAAAAYEGRTEVVKFLVLEAGAVVNMQLQRGMHGSALAAAISGGRTEIVKFLVHEAGANANMQLQNGEYGSALAIAAYEGRTEIAKFLVNEAGAEVNMQLQNGKYGSALVAATEYKQGTEMIKFLVNEAGADVNTHLHGTFGSALAAAGSGGGNNIEIVRLLLQAGADVNMQLQGVFGSALVAAVWGGTDKALKFTVRDGGDLSHFQSTAEISRKDNQVVELLVRNAKADVNQQIRHGSLGSALAAASFFGFKECVDFLIKAGANVSLRIENGLFRTALQACRADNSKEELGWLYWFQGFEQERAEVAELLRLHGATDEA
ncbi:hypothetical protein HD806DRAFT_544007 [Xylariaceae sp. AK1471]|nr:hypothetical protein HD806DRAFT_544007 [Xylariaceae sp. AK1471]